MTTCTGFYALCLIENTLPSTIRREELTPPRDGGGALKYASLIHVYSPKGFAPVAQIRSCPPSAFPTRASFARLSHVHSCRHSEYPIPRLVFEVSRCAVSVLGRPRLAKPEHSATRTHARGAPPHQIQILSRVSGRTMTLGVCRWMPGWPSTDRTSTTLGRTPQVATSSTRPAAYEPLNTCRWQDTGGGSL